MKLATKSHKPTGAIPGIINPLFRREFLQDMPNNAGSRVRGADLALINEALRAIGENNAMINGKIPETREERYIVIASYFKTARTRANMPFDGAKGVKKTCEVAIRHNDTVHNYFFPEVVAQKN